MYAYLWKVIENKKCHPYQIGGVEDHIHIFSTLHPTVTLSGFIKDMKLSMSDFIKREALFPEFRNWQDGYGAFTHSHAEKDGQIKYVRNQVQHHKTETFEEELVRLLTESGVTFEPKYLL